MLMSPETRPVRSLSSFATLLTDYASACAQRADHGFAYAGPARGRLKGGIAVMDNIIRWTGRTLAAVVLTFGVACGHPSTTCTKNSDCAGNLVCTNGACVDPCLSLNPADTPPTLCSQSGTVGAKITFVN